MIQPAVKAAMMNQEVRLVSSPKLFSIFQVMKRYARGMTSSVCTRSPISIHAPKSCAGDPVTLAGKINFSRVSRDGQRACGRKAIFVGLQSAGGTVTKVCWRLVLPGSVTRKGRWLGQKAVGRTSIVGLIVRKTPRDASRRNETPP